MSLSRRRALQALSALPAAGLIGALPRAAHAAEFSLKYGNNLPLTHPLNIRAQEAADRIAKESNGRVEMVIFPNNQLGGDTDMLAQVRSGALTFFTPSALVVATLVPIAAINAVGFAFADYDQVWQSRSGPPQVPWLEPDIADHLTALAEGGTKAVIVCPIGFLADHIEVVWDLDNELRERAQDLGIAFVRTATPNADPRFARLVADLIDDVRTGREPSRVPGSDAPPLQGFSVDGVVCTPNCG